MADIIHLLPDNIANQIAAGEVIQRPASVAKELVENAVDAGAQKIELHIKDAGKTLIQVVDDGKGMTEMDARMSFERHATSKISAAKDLFSLQTKGFRGEALASIGAIAHVKMETIAKDATIGTKIEIKGSKLVLQEPSSHSKGTSISVKNLFYNVPARRNFLKSENVESKHIIEEFKRIALTHPQLHFIYSHNGNILHNIEGASLRKRIMDLFGNSFNKKLVPIEEETDLVKISGFIVKPEFSRKTRGEQYLFVNHRYFKDNYFNHAIVNGYDNLIHPKQYPSYFIYLETPQNSIDVNVHPTKTEIKFQNGKSIYSILRSSVKLALGKYNIAPSLDFEHESQFDLTQKQENNPIQEPKIKVDTNYNPFQTKNKGFSTSGNTNSPSIRPNKEEWEDFYKITEESKINTNSSSNEIEYEDAAITPSSKMQLHQNLLLVQVKSGALIIHLSRAKERILYDELMNQFMKTPIVSQEMMFPYEYPLQDTQKLEWENHKENLRRLGFNWTWKKNTIIFSGIPSLLKIEYVAQCLDSIIEKITYKEIDKGEIVHELILSLVTAASKTQNKSLTTEEMDYIIETLFQSEAHQYSPNGKKIMNTITFDELKNYLC